jgi:alpha-amylase
MSASSGIGSAGNDHQASSKYFPAVPYSSFDFNDGKCKTASGNIENYNDVNQVRDCKLVSLPDLATANEYVRQKIVDYLNTLIDIGVAGFRVDAVKHMWPGDLQNIYSRLKDVRAEYDQSIQSIIREKEF